MISTNWTHILNLKNTCNCILYYFSVIEDGETIYHILTGNAKIQFSVSLNDNNSSDFVTNYKSSSTIVSSQADALYKLLTDFEDKIFDGLEIRDNLTYNSLISENTITIPKTIIIENTLNEPVTIQVQGSRDKNFIKYMNIDTTFIANGNNNSYKTIVDYFPFIRLNVSCTTAPISGDLTAYIEKII